MSPMSSLFFVFKMKILYTGQAISSLHGGCSPHAVKLTKLAGNI